MRISLTYHSQQPQIMPYFGRWLRRPPCISNLPALLAPFLGNSSCFTSAVASLNDHSNFVQETRPTVYKKFPSLTGAEIDRVMDDLWRSKSNRQSQHKRRFSVRTFNKIATEFVSPLVDRGWFCTREVERTLHELLKVHTMFKHLTEDKVFQEIAIITIMFGNLSGGLRQKCIRDILVAALFSHDKGTLVGRLSDLRLRFMSYFVVFRTNDQDTQESGALLQSGSRPRPVPSLWPQAQVQGRHDQRLGLRPALGHE